MSHKLLGAGREPSKAASTRSTLNKKKKSKKLSRSGGKSKRLKTRTRSRREKAALKGQDSIKIDHLKAATTLADIGPGRETSEFYEPEDEPKRKPFHITQRKIWYSGVVIGFIALILVAVTIAIVMLTLTPIETLKPNITTSSQSTPHRTEAFL